LDIVAESQVKKKQHTEAPKLTKSDYQFST